MKNKPKNRINLKIIKHYLYIGWIDFYYFYTIAKHKSLKLIYNKLKTFFSYNIPSVISDFYYYFSASKRKNPDFIVIGVHKGGTTSIYDYLNQHPDIIMSRRKEINYFSKYYFMGIKYYKSFFPRKNVKEITGEVSPYYLFHPHSAKRLKSVFPNIKIIVLLRDPVERAYSHFNMLKNMDPVETFDEVVKLEEKRTKEEGEKVLLQKNHHSVPYQTFSYMKKGLYHKQLSRWAEYLDLNEMLILKSEDFFNNTKKELKKAYEYLNIREVYPKDLSAKNARKYFKINSDVYQKYYPYFEKDQEALKKLLDNHYS